MNRRGLGKCTPTSCPKAGIKIHHSNNDYTPNSNYTKQSKLSKPVNFQNTKLNSLDLI
jgi:hypothetical protein